MLRRTRDSLVGLRGVMDPSRGDHWWCPMLSLGWCSTEPQGWEWIPATHPLNSCNWIKMIQNVCEWRKMQIFSGVENNKLNFTLFLETILQIPSPNHRNQTNKTTGKWRGMTTRKKKKRLMETIENRHKSTGVPKCRNQVKNKHFYSA